MMHDQKKYQVMTKIIFVFRSFANAPQNVA